MKIPTMTPLQIVLGIIGVTIIRMFLESFSSSSFGEFSSLLVLHNYILFFAVVVVSVGIIMGIIVRDPWMKHISRATFFLPIIWIAPIIDLIVSSGACMGYVGTAGSRLWHDFITFFGPLPLSCGITLGIRIEIVIILMATGWYIWKKTRTWWKSLVGIISIYATLFFHVAFPGIIRSFGNTALDPTVFFQKLFSSSLMGTIHTFSSSTGLARFFENTALLGGRIPWIILVILIIITAWHDAPQKCIAWFKNIRLTRTIYYVLIACLGTVVATRIFHLSIPTTFIDITAYVIVLGSLVLSWWTAITLNDIEDISIDTISNRDRPLITQTLNVSDMRTIALLSGIFAISGGLLINWNVVLLISVFQVAYSIYSLKPFYMKMHFFSSSFLLGLSGISLFLVGYFTIAPDQTFRTLPYQLIFALFGTFAIVSNVKDFKDIPGDRAEKIHTLPVVFGARRATLYLVAILIAWTLFWGMRYANIWIIIQIIPWIVLVAIIKITHKKLPEYIFFIVFFAQILSLVIMI